ncbi:hypothetical protein KP509_14G054900 [Ceratopteris richardii]|uniref:Uncharacterized protein n=1 Tax=Ceratopteris richardii TaxID=49495 RepID=A0A8T2T9L5_CERRI|nr:hypothetical protein KP509_14G054900 [Ceratopteris richardii]KAH7415639.1 hypothetical protein KP509_14G054900 [Ceratopteris richardii]
MTTWPQVLFHGSCASSRCCDSSKDQTCWRILNFSTSSWTNREIPQMSTTVLLTALVTASFIFCTSCELLSVMNSQGPQRKASAVEMQKIQYDAALENGNVLTSNAGKILPHFREATKHIEHHGTSLVSQLSYLVQPSSVSHQHGSSTKRKNTIPNMEAARERKPAIAVVRDVMQREPSYAVSRFHGTKLFEVSKQKAKIGGRRTKGDVSKECEVSFHKDYQLKHTHPPKNN